jgi:peroxiredoxin
MAKSPQELVPWRIRAILEYEVFVKIRTFLAAGTIAAVALLASCSKTSTAHASETADAQHADRKPAPDFTLQDANGTPIKLSDYHGKAVLLNFWATWCGPCGLEIPWFTEFQQQYKSKGLEIVGVSMDEEGWKAIKPYIAEHKINYRILLGNDSVSQLYGGVDSLPTTFIIGRDGKVSYVHVGLAGKNQYQKEIENVLGNASTHDTQSTSLRMPAAGRGAGATE